MNRRLSDPTTLNIASTPIQPNSINPLNGEITPNTGSCNQVEYSTTARRSETEQFVTFVAHRLDALPDRKKRRKLEYAIQEAILKVEKEMLE